MNTGSFCLAISFLPWDQMHLPWLQFNNWLKQLLHSKSGDICKLIFTSCSWLFGEVQGTLNQKSCSFSFFEMYWKYISREKNMIWYSPSPFTYVGLSRSSMVHYELRVWDRLPEFKICFFQLPTHNSLCLSHMLS